MLDDLVDNDRVVLLQRVDVKRQGPSLRSSRRGRQRSLGSVGGAGRPPRLAVCFMWLPQDIGRLSGSRRPSSSTEGPPRRARPRRRSRHVAPPSCTLVEGVFVVVVVPVVVSSWGLVPGLRGVQPKKAADGARRRARRAHARRRHRVVVVRARRWLLPYARGRSVLCCYYATGLFMVWARYQCVGGPQSWRNNGPRCCPCRVTARKGSLAAETADRRAAKSTTAPRAPARKRNRRTAPGTCPRSCEWSASSGHLGAAMIEGDRRGVSRRRRVSPQGLIKMSTTASHGAVRTSARPLLTPSARKAPPH